MLEPIGAANPGGATRVDDADAAGPPGSLTSAFEQSIHALTNSAARSGTIALP